MSDRWDRLERLRQAGRLQRRLGLKTAAELEPPAPKPPFPSELSDLPGMAEVEGPGGRFLLRTLRFDLDYRQGRWRLGDWLDLAANGVILVGGEEQAAFAFDHAVFLDTETSGLAGGTGTIVFLTGVGCFEDGHYVVRQYFARHPAEEWAYLPHLQELLRRASGIVSFNGKGFDLPLLRTRFILAGLPPPDRRLPHLDLLHPARRLWRTRLGSCAFGHLEQMVVGHARTIDVPSWLIPSLWLRFATGAGNVADMVRVLQHNLDDVLSMVPLACVIGRALSGIAAPHPADWVALGRTHFRAGHWPAAEAAFRRALEGELTPAQRYEAALGLAAVLKRRGRPAEAVVWWQAAIALDPARRPEPYIELAKYHEWEARDIATALSWTEAALQLVRAWPPEPARMRWLAGLHARSRRLQHKLGMGTQPGCETSVRL
jgi:uncharacterized protein YprB with RNaseH-like and TPR domain